VSAALGQAESAHASGPPRARACSLKCGRPGPVMSLVGRPGAVPLGARRNIRARCARFEGLGALLRRLRGREVRGCHALYTVPFGQTSTGDEGRRLVELVGMAYLDPPIAVS